MHQTIKPNDIPPRFRPAYEAVLGLARDDRYVAALVFGSVARGEAEQQSDFDAKVVVAAATTCAAINHPFVAGVKLDISFNTIEQLRGTTAKEVERGERPPIVAESIIVFDKTGQLTELRDEARRARPLPFDPQQHLFTQFMLYHMHDKATRHLESDPASALLSMHCNFNELLHYHYKFNARWSVSSKRLLADLRQWDPPLALLVEAFVSTCEPAAKYAAWSAIMEHVARPLGGMQPISENNCPCELCAGDLGALGGSVRGHPPAKAGG